MENRWESSPSIMDIFGTNVFNEKAMRQYLPKSIYYELRKTIEGRKELDPAIADVVAAAIKSGQLKREPPITPTGFSRLPVLPPRSTTPSSLPQRKTVPSSWNFPART